MTKILILLQLVVTIAASVGNAGVYADEWPAILHEPMDVS
jgi:hypothetical protein